MWFTAEFLNDFRVPGVAPCTCIIGINIHILIFLKFLSVDRYGLRQKVSVQ